MTVRTFGFAIGLISSAVMMFGVLFHAQSLPLALAAGGFGVCIVGASMVASNSDDPM